MSKGLRLIAAYRAERLRQRLLLRDNLRQSHTALHGSRDTGKAPRCAGSATPAGQGLGTAVSVPQAQGTQSVFADMVNDAEALRRGGEAPRLAEAPLDEAAGGNHADGPWHDVHAAPDMSSRGTAEAGPEDPAEHVEETQPASDPYDPPLAEIGFGPGMLIRLNQLGLNTRGDLAQADADQLRVSLGEISRLIDVETWISNAKHPHRTD